MRCIIAGSRSIEDYGAICSLMEIACYSDNPDIDWPEITEVVCGCAVGVDRLGYKWARENGIPVSFWPAWEGQGAWAYDVHRPADGEVIHDLPVVTVAKYAGSMRNRHMADYAKGEKTRFELGEGAVVVLWTGEPGGSANMVEVAWNLRLRLLHKAGDYPVSARR